MKFLVRDVGDDVVRDVTTVGQLRRLKDDIRHPVTGEPWLPSFAKRSGNRVLKAIEEWKKLPRQSASGRQTHAAALFSRAAEGDRTPWALRRRVAFDASSSGQDGEWELGRVMSRRGAIVVVHVGPPPLTTTRDYPVSEVRALYDCERSRTRPLAVDDRVWALWLGTLKQLWCPRTLY